MFSSACVSTARTDLIGIGLALEEIVEVAFYRFGDVTLGTTELIVVEI